MSTRVDKPVMKAMQRGFTLTEVMWAILIAAILAAVAIPSMQSLSRKSQQVNAIGDISSMLSRARSEAATRYVPVTLCVSTDGTTCSASTTWESGWLMFFDSNNNQVHEATEDIIQVGAALPSGSSLTALYFVNAGANANITFSKGGLPRQAGTFRYCINNGAQRVMQAINLTASGQVRIATDANGDGTLENNAGTAITACP